MSIRTALLTAALATTGLAGGAQAHSGASWGGAQHKHVKGSRICRFRIVKRRVGSSTVSSKTGSDRAGDLTGGTVDVLVGAEVVETLRLDTPTHGQVITRGRTTARAGAPVSVTFEAPVLDDSGTPIGETEWVTIDLDAIGPADTTGRDARGWQVAARLTERGRLRAVITHDLAGWRGDGIAQVDHQTDSPELAPLAIQEVRQRWVGRLRTDLSERPAVTVASAFTDQTGGVVAAQIGAYGVGDGLVPGLVDATLSDDADGHAVLTGWTRSAGAAALAATLVDYEVEAPVADVEARPQATQQVLLTDPLAFEPGEAPTGFSYVVLLDLLDGSRTPVGTQYEIDMVLPAPITEGAWHGRPHVFADGAGELVAINGPDGYQLQVTWAGEGAGTVTGVNVVFEEPYEGPAPLEIEVHAAPVVQWDAWSIPLGVDLPALSAVSTTLLDAEGQPLATDGFTVAGEGRTVRGAAADAGCTREGDVQVCAADPRTRALRAPTLP